VKRVRVLALTLAAAAYGAVAAAADAADVAETATAIVEQTNALRAEQGLAPLRGEGALEGAARGFARYMARSGNYGHTADGRQPVERAAAEGYEHCIVAENIAYRYRSTGYAGAGELAGAFVDGWAQSPEHRRNMLEPAVTDTGVAVVQDEAGRYFAVQMFGRPKRAAIRFEVHNGADQRIHYRAGGEAFSLSPRETRRHLVCRRIQLTIAQVSPSPPFTAQAADGARYTVRADGAVAVSGPGQ